MATTSWSAFLSELEQAQRAGRSAWVIQRLTSLNRRQVPKELRSSLADLARRAGSALLSLKILVPKMDDPLALSTPEERLSFAAGLFALGAKSAGFKHLSEIPEDRPQRLFVAGLAHMRSWDYGPAIRCFKTYLRHNSLTDYQRLTGITNLLAGLIAIGDHRAADRLFEQAESQAKFLQANLLLANIYEIRTQSLFQRGLTAEAERTIQLASELDPDNSPTSLFIQKWKVVLKGQETDKFHFTNDIDQLRWRAQQMEHWETVRDCDRRLLEQVWDEKLYYKVYFGTPYKAFRQQLLTTFQHPLPKEFVYQFQDNNGRVIDREGEKNWPSTHRRLLLALTNDLYRPMPLGELYEQLFPNEHFNPHSSVNRVAQVVTRFRKSMKDLAIPLDVHSSNHFFYLNALGPLAIRYRKKLAPVNSIQSCHLLELKNLFAGKSFSPRQGRTALGLSDRTFRRVLSWGLEHGLLNRSGGLRNRRYQFASQKSSGRWL